MKPIKPLKFMLTPKSYFRIEYTTTYSHGVYLIQSDLYTVYKKKFDKLFKDCTIERMEQFEYE